MKAKTISKRVLSVILCTVMLFSCWVFTAPSASAATAGQYTWRIRMTSSNNTGGWDGSTLTVYGKKTNGTASEETIWGGSRYDFNWKNETRYPTGDKTTDQFPTKVTYFYDFGGGWTKREMKGNIYIDLYYDGSWHEIGSLYCHSNEWGENKGTKTLTVSADNYPKANSITAISGDSSVAVPTGGGTTTKTYTAGTVKDQYGVNWHENASLSMTATNGCTFSNGTLSVPASANRSANYNVTIKETCGSASNTKSVSITTFDYIVVFKDHDGTTLKTQSGIDYGGSAEVPSTPSRNPDSTNHYAFDSWSGTYTSLTTGAQTKTVTATYTGTAHSGWVYSPISGDHEKHTKKCGSCTYATTVNHNYGATTFTFEEDGKTATAKRVCQTAGCSHTQTQTVTCTSVEKTPATCLVKGWTTYTATSPWGDGATKTKDVQDIDSLGHSWNPTTFTFSEDGTAATATRVCKNDSDHTETQNATMSHAQKTAPTCTEKGWNTYTATSPFEGDTATDTNDVQDIPALDHDWGEWTDYDNATQHQRVCSRDANHIEYKDHNWSGWQHAAPIADETGVRATVRAKLTKAGYSEESSCFNYCTVCGYTKIQTHPDWVVVQDETVTYPATCEAAGQTTSECPDCHKTKVTPIAATGHNWARWEGCSEESVSKLNDIVNVVFECQNGCHSYCKSSYNSTKQEYEYDDSKIVSEPTDDSLASKDPIKTPSFNEHEEFFDGQDKPPYSYNERKASLRVRSSEKGTDTQAMRFSGNLYATEIFNTVSFDVNPNRIFNNSQLMSLDDIRAKNAADKAAIAAGETVEDVYDDTILDFGFVFTQARFIRTAKTVIDYDLMTLDNIGTDYRIYRMSVVGNNLANYNQSKSMDNWKGLTVCDDGDLTFNLVIDVNEKNYQATYVARTYVIYKYHGDIICVYDQPIEHYDFDEETWEEIPNHYYSHDSVYNQAHKVLTLTEPTDFVRSYLEDKITNKVDEGKVKQNFNDWDWKYTLKDFPKQEEY